MDALQLPGAFLDAAVDVVLGHVGVFGGLDGLPEPGIGRGIPSPQPGGDGDFLDQTGEQPAPLGVGGAFFMFDA